MMSTLNPTYFLVQNFKNMSPRIFASFPAATNLLKVHHNLQITQSTRPMSSNKTPVVGTAPEAFKLQYSQFGDPLKVIQKQEEHLRELQPNEVLIKMIASPVNPADINQIQGKYPVKPSLPAVPGNEGVGKVVKVGPGVTDLREGDHVVPLNIALGLWRTHLVLPKSSVLKVPQKLGVVEAATLTVNPCTAYRMLRDFENLKPGDVVIQNGANSACGQNVIQIARAWAIKTVNIVRNRPDIDHLKDSLKTLGATYVLTEEELRTTQIFKNNEVPRPKLGLNCVGGQSSLELLRHMQKSSTMVTYGGMSREPVTVPTSALIFKDLKIRGFWMSQWTLDNADSVDRFEMFEELISMMTNNELRGPACKVVSFDQYKEALLNTMTIKGMTGKKYILNFEE